MSTHASREVSPSPAAVVLEPEVSRCGVCGDTEEIWLHCSKCKKAIGSECVLDSEMNSGKCSLCNPARLPRRRGRR